MSELEIYKRALKMACSKIYNTDCCWCPVEPDCIFLNGECGEDEFAKCWSDYFLSKAYE